MDRDRLKFIWVNKNVEEMAKELDYLLPYKLEERTPTVTGDYLVHHRQYGWCVWGFTTLDAWGYHLGNITHWANLPKKP